MTDLEYFFEMAQEDKNLTAIFEQMGCDMDSFNEDYFREAVQTAIEICKHGIGGGYTGFIYYTETEEFFNRHEDDILDYFEERFTISEFLEIVREKLDITDIVDRTPYAMNFYVWLYVEMVLSAFCDDLEDALNGRE